MPEGMPYRCDPPEDSPLLDGWTPPVSEDETTTTQAPEDTGIILPPSGLLCGEIVTTEPPDNSQERVCRLYTLQALQNNTRDAVISIVNCLSLEEEVHTMAPDTCLFLYSLIEPVILDPGFGSTDQPSGDNGSGSGDNNDDDDDNEDDDDSNEDEDDGSIVGDTDGDGVPDVGVIINPPADCVVELPSQENPPEEAPGGGDTTDGGETPASDAGTGGGVTGQAPPTGVASGIIYDGPEASAMFCQSFPYDPLSQVVTSGNWVKITSVGYGNTLDEVMYTPDGIQRPITYRPNAIFVSERDAEDFAETDTELYRTYVTDKEIPTIYDSSGNYTYQKHRELAFQTPKQTATQQTIDHDPNDMKLMFDNYKNQSVAGNRGYIVLESTTDINDDSTTAMYTFLLNDGYDFNPDGASYNSSGINVIGTPASVDNIQGRTYRYTVNGLDFKYDNFKTLNNLLPRDRVIHIDGGDIRSPEFFSWNMDSGIPIGYGWDSGTYRLQSGGNWLNETHTTYDHKLIPVNIDESYRISNQDMIMEHDDWYPRLNSRLEPSRDQLRFDRDTLMQLESQGIDINNIFLEVVTAHSYTENQIPIRPDGSHMVNRVDLSDNRLFPRMISNKHIKRSMFTFGPSGNFIDLKNYSDNVRTLFNVVPESPYTYYRYEMLPIASEERCFDDDCRFISDQEISTDYWDMNISLIDIAYPSGHPVTEEALSAIDDICRPCSNPLECCQPFATSKKVAFNNYQDLVIQGSGYVPINFYPCTISDKISQIRQRTIDPDGDGGGGGGTTTTLFPTTGYSVEGGIWSEPRVGCYRFAGTLLGTKVYQKSIEGPDGLCVYQIYYNGLDWVINSTCESQGSTEWSTVRPETGDDEPPLTGWSNGYSLSGC
jgi:hypothetical protein